MVKRLISANASEILSMSKEELKLSIKASEGRVVVSENVATKEPFIGDITNTEIARAFGADLILLNGVDVFKPHIFGLDHKPTSFVQELHRLTGCPIGINLEPIDTEAEMNEEALSIAKGRQASLETLKHTDTLGMDFVCLTGNPGTGVSNKEIEAAIKLAKENFSGLIIAGKMHGAGVNESVVSIEEVKRFLDNGADIILVPALGTVPGFNAKLLTEIVEVVHQHGGLVMTAIGTSQESSDEDTIKQMTIQNKICGVDLQHIGDAGYGGIAPVENIFAMSKALRGIRHSISRVARSVNR
ncbi:haloacid dehalogenase-like hydrolase [Paraliobacillus sp. JSM ZJ581]|uniref:DUF7916 family protein n=1 Tax=Paraliobacillus sp. JSM ZJ581 TaxID=3342118 RepID=UPI0035A91D2A